MGFPKQRVITLKYVCFYELPPDNSGSFSYYSFRANSIYDPEVATGGHQPMGADQWGQFYDHYTVIGSKISVTASQHGNNTAPGLWGTMCTTNPSLSQYSNPTGIMESGTGKWKQFQVGNNAPRAGTVSVGYSAKSIWNLQSVKDNQDEIGAFWGADPSRAAYFHVWSALNPATTGNTSALTLAVTIYYRVLLAQPRLLLLS